MCGVMLWCVVEGSFKNVCSLVVHVRTIGSLELWHQGRCDGLCAKVPSDQITMTAFIAFH